MFDEQYTSSSSSSSSSIPGINGYPKHMDIGTESKCGHAR